MKIVFPVNCEIFPIKRANFKTSLDNFGSFFIQINVVLTFFWQPNDSAAGFKIILLFIFRRHNNFHVGNDVLLRGGVMWALRVYL